MGRKAIDIEGKRFGSLVVIRRVGTDDGGKVMWKCACDCGGTHITLSQTLRSGQCTRCPACMKAHRSPTELPETVVDVYLRAHGSDGGLVVARDTFSRRVVAASNLTKLPVKGSVYSYGPLRFVIEQLAKAGRMPERRRGYSLERWVRHSGVPVTTHWLTPAGTMDAAWAEVQASGVLPPRPELEAIGGRVVYLHA